MRKSILLLLILTLLTALLSGCTQSYVWKDDDFSFYKDGSATGIPRAEEYIIYLKDYSGSQTYRGVEIGDEAQKALKLYDLADFTYQIKGFDNVATYRKSNVIEEMQKQAPTAAGILDHLDELSDQKLILLLSCNIYKQDNKLCTVSALNTNDGINNNHKLKYILTFEIIENRISDVHISNNYFRLLPTLTENIEDDWIRELNN